MNEPKFQLEWMKRIIIVELFVVVVGDSLADRWRMSCCAKKSPDSTAHLVRPAPTLLDGPAKRKPIEERRIFSFLFSVGEGWAARGGGKFGFHHNGRSL